MRFCCCDMVPVN